MPPQISSPEEIMDAILKHEGGFVDHPLDRGGPTKFGITSNTLASWRGTPVGVSDVKELQVEEAREIYHYRYYVEPKIDQLPLVIQPLVLDMSINHGPATAVELLQEVLTECGGPCRIDGIIGDETLKSVGSVVDRLDSELVDRLIERRIDFYQSIVKRDNSQQVFLDGWLKRARKFTV